MRKLAKIKNKKITKALSLVIALILIIGSFVGCGKEEEEPTTTAPTTEATTLPPVPQNVNPLTGEVGYPEELIGNRSVLVSVENHPDARPQWGIASADIVWELLAEGGITRMLCMFADASRLPDKIGPTRSARHYFVEIAEGFDSIFVHFGGSPQGYNALDNHGTNHIDGMSDSGFHRDRSRNVASEHTAYTTKDDVINNIDKKDFRTTAEEGKDKPFKFNQSPVTLSGGACTAVSVPFSSSYLKNHPLVEKVNHPAVSEDPSQQELYKKYFPNGGGSIFTFEIKGGEETAKKFIDNLELFSLLANVADVKSLVIHPYSTTHAELNEQELAEQGIKPNTIRLSIGTENIDDIIEDLDEAFKSIQ